MGGFLIKDGDHRRTLLSDDLKSNALDPMIFRRINISKQEIQDKSKGDPLSKGLALFQTIWFFVQCILRLAHHFPITELEIMTGAYVVLTIATYALWWNKPLDVMRPVLIQPYEDEDDDTGDCDDGGRETEDIKDRIRRWWKTLKNVAPAITNMLKGGFRDGRRAFSNAKRRAAEGVRQEGFIWLIQASGSAFVSVGSALFSALKSVIMEPLFALARAGFGESGDSRTPTTSITVLLLDESPLSMPDRQVMKTR